MAALQMLGQFWQFFLVLVMIFFGPFRCFCRCGISLTLSSTMSKPNAMRPVTLTHNSVTDKYFTAIWNRSLFHIVVSFFLICFPWIEFLRLIRLFDWFVLLSSHLLYYLFSPRQFFCVSTQNMQFHFWNYSVHWDFAIPWSFFGSILVNLFLSCIFFKYG